MRLSDFCPYITSRPTVSWRELRPTDKAVVLASDGLWNFISAEDVANIMHTALEREAREDSSYSLASKHAKDGQLALPSNFRFDSHKPQSTSKTEGTTFVEAEGANTGEILGVNWCNDGGAGDKIRWKSLSDSDEEKEEEEAKDPAGALLSLALKNSAFHSHLPLWKLMEMPAGDTRRKYVDDITVMVVSL